MTKNEFLSLLDKSLRNAPLEERKEILYDYQEHFNIGLEQGNSEDDICKSLGDPKIIARQYKVDSIVKNAETNKSVGNILKAIFAAISLGFFNLVFIIPVFAGLVGVLIGLYCAALGITIGGVALLAGIVLAPAIPDLISVPAINTGILIFTSFGLMSLGLLFSIADVYITKFFYKITIAYIKANIGIINIGGKKDV